MPKTLREVCDTLISQYGHQDLWFDWRPWANEPGRPDLAHQPMVISCSRRELAEYDGRTWHFLNSPLYLHFNPEDDFYDPAVAGDIYLDDLAFKKLQLFFFL
ncbi:hypothetical protein ACI09C_004424 [Cronobacter turicensis]